MAQEASSGQLTMTVANQNEKSPQFNTGQMEAPSTLESQLYSEIQPDDPMLLIWFLFGCFVVYLIAKFGSTFHKITHLKKSGNHVAYAMILFFSIVCLLLAPQLDRDGWSAYFRLVLEGIGSSGIVALILIYTVEAFVRREHESAAEATIRMIKEDLFHSIYGRYIPPDVFEQVEKGIMQCDFYRTDYSFDYCLMDFSEDEVQDLVEHIDHKFLKCVVKTRYELHNTSGTDASHDIEMHIEYPIDSGLRRYVGVTALFIDNEAVDIQADQPDSVKDPGFTYQFRHRVKVPAQGKVSVVLHHKTIKRALDMEVWASRIPSSGVSFTIKAPDTISVEASANHIEKLIEVKCPMDNEREWKLPHGILPFQSVVFWWKRESLVEQRPLELEDLPESRPAAAASEEAEGAK